MFVYVMCMLYVMCLGDKRKKQKYTSARDT